MTGHFRKHLHQLKTRKRWWQPTSSQMIMEGFDRKAQRLATSNEIDLEDIDYSKSDLCH